MESWQTQPLLLLKIGSYTELQVVADGTQNFESDCFIVARLIAFAGETTDIDTTNTIPKLSNLFFIFPLSFRFLFLWMADQFFLVATTKIFTPHLEWGRSYHTKLPHIFFWEIKTKNNFIPSTFPKPKTPTLRLHKTNVACFFLNVSLGFIWSGEFRNQIP